ncbi:hypothetical protein OGAPHI_005758 [Ogataea philodendri]|uniref:Uncharacterized protein n=1 Tax=Ogataea philodendri TaxID=1378263 RepID=A0A9P8T1G3_9ASCO|nr:uncharacterized protein OGAPHI_005758 [Ogataea philodendri]KAH3662506.1 hypothetical protein OGAPHI_005758 [Ogataea philodendri]
MANPIAAHKHWFTNRAPCSLSVPMPNMNEPVSTISTSSAVSVDSSLFDRSTRFSALAPEDRNPLFISTSKAPKWSTRSASSKTPANCSLSIPAWYVPTYPETSSLTIPLPMNVSNTFVLPASLSSSTPRAPVILHRPSRKLANSIRCHHDRHFVAGLGVAVTSIRRIQFIATANPVQTFHIIQMLQKVQIEVAGHAKHRPDSELPLRSCSSFLHLTCLHIIPRRGPRQLERIAALVAKVLVVDDFRLDPRNPSNKPVPVAQVDVPVAVLAVLQIVVRAAKVECSPRLFFVAICFLAGWRKCFKEENKIPNFKVAERNLAVQFGRQRLQLLFLLILVLLQFPCEGLHVVEPTIHSFNDQFAIDVVEPQKVLESFFNVQALKKWCNSRHSYPPSGDTALPQEQPRSKQPPSAHYRSDQCLPEPFTLLIVRRPGWSSTDVVSLTSNSPIDSSNKHTLVRLPKISPLNWFSLLYDAWISSYRPQSNWSFEMSLSFSDLFTFTRFDSSSSSSSTFNLSSFSSS